MNAPNQTIVDQAYDAACAADAQFQKELVRQFGEKAAGDARYETKRHDAATTAARKAFKAAVDSMRAVRLEN